MGRGVDDLGIGAALTVVDMGSGFLNAGGTGRHRVKDGVHDGEAIGRDPDPRHGLEIAAQQGGSAGGKVTEKHPAIGLTAGRGVEDDEDMAAAIDRHGGGVRVGADQSEGGAVGGITHPRHRVIGGVADEQVGGAARPAEGRAIAGEQDVAVVVADLQCLGGEAAGHLGGAVDAGADGDPQVVAIAGLAVGGQRPVRLDGAGRPFQRPVAVPAGGVGRGRDVGAGGGGQIGDEGLSVRSLGDIAAIDQDVAAGLQAVTDLRQFRQNHRGGQAGLGQDIGADGQLSLGTVAQHMDGVIAGMGPRPLGDLGQPVVAAADQLDLDPGADAVRQCLVVGDGGIDEGHLAFAAIQERIGGANLHRRRYHRDQRLGRCVGGGMGGIDDGGAVEHPTRLQRQEAGREPGSFVDPHD